MSAGSSENDGVSLHSTHHPSKEPETLEQSILAMIEARATQFPSAFRKWFEQSYKRPPQPHDPLSELSFTAWSAGYTCCFNQHTR